MKTSTVATMLVFVCSLPLAGGFAAETVEAVIPGVTEADVQVVRGWWRAQGQASAVPAEVARVVWRVARMSDQQVADRLAQASDASPELPRGIEIDGEAVAIQKIAVPERLAESFDFDAVWLVNVEIDGEQQGLLCKQIPPQWKATPSLRQPVRARGFLVATASQEAPNLIVCDKLQWFPSQDDPNQTLPEGWLLLSKAGFDVGQFDLIERHNRGPLSSAESSAFYEFLKAADRVASDATASPRPIRPQVLLSGPPAPPLIGQYVRVRLETARIQQIIAPGLQQQIGQDHYWEIDALGELDNAEVRIQPKDGGEPITFGNRYPVTLAMLKLPPFLSDLVTEDGRVSKAMLMHKAMIDVDGFFYRLWTYETDFVSSKGGDRQIGPLIAVTAISIKPEGTAKASLARIGWGIAIVFLTGFLATVAYLSRAAKADRKMRHKRSKLLPDTIAIPEEGKPGV